MANLNDRWSSGLKVAEATADADAVVSGAIRVMAVDSVGTGTVKLVDSSEATTAGDADFTVGAGRFVDLKPNGVKFAGGLSLDVTNANPVAVFYVVE